MSRYRCHGCEVWHGTDNVVAYCAFCYAGLKTSLLAAEQEIKRLTGELEKGWQCGGPDERAQRLESRAAELGSMLDDAAGRADRAENKAVELAKSLAEVQERINGLREARTMFAAEMAGRLSATIHERDEHFALSRNPPLSATEQEMVEDFLKALRDLREACYTASFAPATFPAPSAEYHVCNEGVCRVCGRTVFPSADPEEGI